MNTTTTSLIEGLQAGNSRSLSKFKQLYSPAILKICRDTCDDQTVADEIAKRSIEAVLRRMKYFERRKGKKFRNYVTTVVISQIKDYWRKQYSLSKRIESQNFVEQFDNYVLRRTIAALKETKSIRKQSWEMFHLHYEEKISVEVIAMQFEVAPDSVKRTLRRIRNEIRKLIDE